MVLLNFESHRIKNVQTEDTQKPYVNESFGLDWVRFFLYVEVKVD